jgi:phospholipase C
VPADQTTGDIIHRYYHEQLQIDSGRMDKFVTWSDNGGLVFSYIDATNMPEGQLAQQYTICDNFFHSAFGGSFLNHQFLIAAAPPTWPNAPADAISNPDPNNLNDARVTPDGFAVNTAYTVNAPHPASITNPAELVPLQTNPTIGDRLTAKGISWKWYSGGWNDALAGNPDPLFQFHHQPFAYYANYADGTQAKADHLQDEQNFFDDLAANNLPSVCFIKPLGPDNEHPGYANLAQGQMHVAQIVQMVQASPIWKDAVIIITYDENGGRWDHVPPPVIDAFGPGTRVPTIIISRFAKKHFVDHTQYETVSILKLIEERFGLDPLSDRDANAADLSHAFKK